MPSHAAVIHMCGRMYNKYLRALWKQKNACCKFFPVQINANLYKHAWRDAASDSYRFLSSNTHPAKRGFYAERHETLSSCCLQQRSLMRAALAHGQVRLSLSHLMMADSCQGGTSENTHNAVCLTAFPVFECFHVFTWGQSIVIFYFTIQYRYYHCQNCFPPV